MRISDWSSDVCSSDLAGAGAETGTNAGRSLVVGRAGTGVGKFAWRNRCMEALVVHPHAGSAEPLLQIKQCLVIETQLPLGAEFQLAGRFAAAIADVDFGLATTQRHHALAQRNDVIGRALPVEIGRAHV